MRHCNGRSCFCASSGEPDLHRLTKDPPNGVGIAVLFSIPKRSLAADNGIEIIVTEFGLNRGFARLAGHGIFTLDRRGSMIVPVRSIGGQTSGPRLCALFPREQGGLPLLDRIEGP